MLKKIFGYTCLGVIALTVVFAAIMGIIATRRYDNIDAPVADASFLWTQEGTNPLVGVTFDKDGYMLVSQETWDTATELDDTLVDDAKTAEENRIKIWKMDKKVGIGETMSKAKMTKRYIKHAELSIDEVINAQRDEDIRIEKIGYADADTEGKADIDAEVKYLENEAEADIAAAEFQIKTIKNGRADTRDNAFKAGWNAFADYFEFQSGLGFIVVALGVSAYILLKKEEEVKKSAK